jgi:hypothetical protein
VVVGKFGNMGGEGGRDGSPEGGSRARIGSGDAKSSAGGTPGAVAPNPSPGRDGEARIFPRARGAEVRDGGEAGAVLSLASPLSFLASGGMGPARVSGRGVRVGGGKRDSTVVFVWRPSGFREGEATLLLLCCAAVGKPGLLPFSTWRIPSRADRRGMALPRRLEPSRGVYRFLF